MGIFSSLGAIVGGAFFGPTGAKIGAGLGGAVDSKKSHKRYSGGTKETQESRINFQQMADDARAAGFNPLTALRTTGGMGNVTTRYSTPLIDHGKFGIGDALAGAYSGYSNFKAMEQQKQKFGLETDLIKSQIALNKSNAIPKVVEDIWGKYNDTNKKMSVNYLGTEFVIPGSMAEFHRIKPNSSLGAGTMTELFGEGFELLNFFSSEGQQVTFGIDVLGRRHSDGTPNMNPKYTVSTNKVIQYNPSGLASVNIHTDEIIKIKKLPSIHPNIYGPNKHGLNKNDPISNTLNNLMNYAF